jgi:hypothetical protein
MSLTEPIKTALKRGALVTAANWEVVLIQFVAESAFKALLMVPVVGAAFLVTLLVGSSVEEIISGDLRQTIALAIAALGEHRSALVAYLVGVAVVLVGGSMLMFVVKAGSVGVLVDADRAGPPVEQPPLRIETVRRAERFSLEAFSEASTRFRHRFMRLGLGLLVVYAATGSAYLMVLVSTYRVTSASGAPWLGTIGAALASTVVVGWITLVNLAYLLLQVLVVSRDVSVARAVAALPGFLSGDRRLVGGVFLVVLVLVLIATAASILATAALGFIGFVPIVGLAMLPLQLLAWIGRGLLFEFLGLAALTTYAGLMRRAAGSDRAAVLPRAGLHRTQLRRRNTLES